MERLRAIVKLRIAVMLATRESASRIFIVGVDHAV